jgi:hypothetical protein
MPRPVALSINPCPSTPVKDTKHRNSMLTLAMLAVLSLAIVSVLGFPHGRNSRQRPGALERGCIEEAVEFRGDLTRLTGGSCRPVTGIEQPAASRPAHEMATLGMPDEAQRDALYDTVPQGTNILITHGPPLGILDDGQGCSALRRAVIRVKPRLHCFGHVHTGYGTLSTKNTSSLTLRFWMRTALRAGSLSCWILRRDYQQRLINVSQLLSPACV